MTVVTATPTMPAADNPPQRPDDDDLHMLRSYRKLVADAPSQQDSRSYVPITATRVAEACRRRPRTTEARDALGAMGIAVARCPTLSGSNTTGGPSDEMQKAWWDDHFMAARVLLRLAGEGANADDAQTFMVSASAWKVITALMLNSSRTTETTCKSRGSVNDDLRKQVIFCSASAASSVLRLIRRLYPSETGLDAAPISANRGASAAQRQTDSTVVQKGVRLARILRFHTMNLARCSRHFVDRALQLDAKDESVSAVLRLAAGVLRVTMNAPPEWPPEVVTELRDHVHSAACGALRAVLTMCGGPCSIESALNKSYAVSSTAQVAPENAADSLAAMIYLVATADAEQAADCHRSPKLVQRLPYKRSLGPAQPEGAQQGSRRSSSGQIRSVPALSRTLFSLLDVALLPMLLDAMRRLLEAVPRAESRTRYSQLLRLALSASTDAAVRYVLVRGRVTRALWFQLLERVTMDPAELAFTAAECILVAFSATRNHQELQIALLRDVVKVARLALATASPKLEARFVPLIGRLLDILQAQGKLNGELLYRAEVVGDFSAQSKQCDEAPLATSGSGDLEANVPFDVIALLAVGDLCWRLSWRTTGSAERCAASVKLNLGLLQVDPGKIGRQVEKIVHNQQAQGALLVASVRLLPYVRQSVDISSTVHSLLRRRSLTLDLVLSIASLIDPQHMAHASLLHATKLAVSVSRQFGPGSMPSLAAIAVRAVTEYNRERVSELGEAAHHILEFFNTQFRKGILREMCGGMAVVVARHLKQLDKIVRPAQGETSAKAAADRDGLRDRLQQSVAVALSTLRDQLAQHDAGAEKFCRSRRTGNLKPTPVISKDRSLEQLRHGLSLVRGAIVQLASNSSDGFSGLESIVGLELSSMTPLSESLLCMTEVSPVNRPPG